MVLQIFVLIVSILSVLATASTQSSSMLNPPIGKENIHSRTLKAKPKASPSPRLYIDDEADEMYEDKYENEADEIYEDKYENEADEKYDDDYFYIAPPVRKLQQKANKSPSTSPALVFFDDDMYEDKYENEADEIYEDKYENEADEKYDDDFFYVAPPVRKLQQKANKSPPASPALVFFDDDMYEDKYENEADEMYEDKYENEADEKYDDDNFFVAPPVRKLQQKANKSPSTSPALVFFDDDMYEDKYENEADEIYEDKYENEADEKYDDDFFYVAPPVRKLQQTANKSPPKSPALVFFDDDMYEDKYENEADEIYEDKYENEADEKYDDDYFYVAPPVRKLQKVSSKSPPASPVFFDDEAEDRYENEADEIYEDKYENEADEKYDDDYYFYNGTTTTSVRKLKFVAATPPAEEFEYEADESYSETQETEYEYETQETEYEAYDGEDV